MDLFHVFQTVQMVPNHVKHLVCMLILKTWLNTKFIKVQYIEAKIFTGLAILFD